MQTIFSEVKKEEEISGNDNGNIHKGFKEQILNVSEDTVDQEITPEKSRSLFYASH
jgi:hypothetical protein